MPSDLEPSRERDAWEAAVAKLLKGTDRDALVTRSRDGVATGPLFSKAERPMPMPWRAVTTPFGVSQRIDHADPAKALEQALVDRDNGANGLTVVAAGAASARGFGVEAEAITDVTRLLEGLSGQGLALRLDFPLRLAAEAVGAIHARRGAELPLLDVGFDPLGWLAVTGEDDADVGRAVTAAQVEIQARGFACVTHRADGRPYHEAGASEAQELAAVVATGLTSLRALESAGLEAARSSISFTLAADADQVLTIAKCRALRRLWARVEEACGLDPKPIRLHVETAWRMLARREPDTNLLRNAIAASAAIMGGADSLTVLPHTSAVGLPDAFARRLARNTSLVLAEEAQIGRVADPAAGAGAFEAVTEGLCDAAWLLFQDLEASGGLAAALRAGTWQAAIAGTRRARQADFKAKRGVIVGVTRFTADGEAAPEREARKPASPLHLPSLRDADCFEEA